MSDKNQEVQKYRDLGFTTQAMAAGCDSTRTQALRTRYAEQYPKREAKIAVIRTQTLDALK